MPTSALANLVNQVLVRLLQLIDRLLLLSIYRKMATLRVCGAFLNRPALRSPQVRQLWSTGKNLAAIEGLRALNSPVSVVRTVVRTHKNFGHNPPKPSLHTRLWVTFLGVGLVAAYLDWKW